MGEEHRQRPQRTRRGFTKEFKRDAVELVRRIDRGEAEGLTTEERARLRQLEAENTRLRMERDLLKRTVAFWVKKTSTP
jgi:transposase